MVIPQCCKECRHHIYYPGNSLEEEYIDCDLDWECYYCICKHYDNEDDMGICSMDGGFCPNKWNNENECCIPGGYVSEFSENMRID